MLSLIGISPGELYNRTKIMQSRQALLNSDLFDLNDIRQIPHPEQGTLDLEYELSKPYNAVLHTFSNEKTFSNDKVIGLILINGQPLKGVKVGMKGIVSIKMENQELLADDSPIRLTIQINEFIQDPKDIKPPAFSKSWNDYRELGNFDISVALSHSQPGDVLYFTLANGKFRTGAMLGIRE